MEFNTKNYKYSYQKIKLLINNADFIEKSQKIIFEHINIKYPKIKRKVGEDINRPTIEIKKQTEFYNKIDLLLKDFKIPLHYKKLIINILGIGDPFFIPYIGETSTKKCSVIEKEERLFIEIFPDTTMKDINKIWDKEIVTKKKKLIGYKLGRPKIIKNLERNLYILKLKEKGLTYKRIKEELEKKYPRTKTPFYNDMPKILYKFKKKIKKG